MAASVPSPILIEIFKLLPVEDLFAVNAVNRSWRSASNQDSVWKPHCNPRWATDLASFPSWKQLYIHWLHAQVQRVQQNTKGTLLPWKESLTPLRKLPTKLDDLFFKIFVFGDHGVGKTTFISKLKPAPIPGMIDVATQRFRWRGYTVNLQLSRNSEEFLHSEKADPQGIILLFDLRRVETLKNFFRLFSNSSSNAKYSVFLVGNEFFPKDQRKESVHPFVDNLLQDLVQYPQVTYCEVCVKEKSESMQLLEMVVEKLAATALSNSEVLLPVSTPSEEFFSSKVSSSMSDSQNESACQLQ